MPFGFPPERAFSFTGIPIAPWQSLQIVCHDAAKREKLESENDELVLMIQDRFKGDADARILAIRKLAASGSSRVGRVLARAFQETDYGRRVHNAAFAELERMGLGAVPALACVLKDGREDSECRAAKALGRLGGTTCESILKARVDGLNPEHTHYASLLKCVTDALQELRDPRAAKLREEREAREDAVYKREIRTHDPAEAMSAIFEDMILEASELTTDEVAQCFTRWSGPSAGVSLQRRSAQASEQLVRAHLESLRVRHGFESYRIVLNREWRCVFVTTFYGGVANFLLVWRCSDGCAVAHT